MAFPALDLVLFIASLIILVNGAEFAVKYSSRLTKSAGMSKFMTSVFVVSVISTFPEATVSIVSAFKGIPEFGMGTLLGSNVADLTLVFGIAALFSSGGIRVKREILRHDIFYLALLLMPSVLGSDGHLSRLDGILLVASGLSFFAALSLKWVSRSLGEGGGHWAKTAKIASSSKGKEKAGWKKELLFLMASIGVLLASAYFTVKFGVGFAEGIGIPPFIVALTVVAVGTCLPELIFSIKSVGKGENELALGDVLGTVVIDATILVGALALINPFSFNPRLIYVTGALMALSGFIALEFMRSGRILTRKEGILLILVYVITLMAEFLVGRAF